MKLINKLLAVSAISIAIAPGVVSADCGKARLADFDWSSANVHTAIVGFISGILGGFAALGGILPTIWVNLQRLPKNTQRGTYEPFIFIPSIVAVVSFYFAGFLNLDIFYYFLMVLPALIIGSLIGVKIYSFIDEDLFKKVILGLIFLAGLVLLF